MASATASVPAQLEVVAGRVHAFESVVPDSAESEQYRQDLDRAIQGMLSR